MDGLMKGLDDAMLDGVESAVSRDQRGAAAARSREQGPRSTWAEVVSADRADNDTDQHRRHLPTSDQRFNQDRIDERKSRNWDNATGNDSRQASKCRAEQDGDEKKNKDCIAVGGRKRHKRPHKHFEEWKGYKRPPAEQEYSEDVSYIHHGLNVEPTREELTNLSKACGRLWDLDLNRLTPGKDYRIECGEGKKVYQKVDMASENLFSWLADDVLRKPTYARFCALLDNYNPHQGHKELVTQQEKHEEAAFIEEIARSAPIKYLHRYLVLKGVTTEDYRDFKKILSSLWFDLYGRGGCSGSSSAFEHVFVGEIKGRRRGDNEVTGFHNWIQFYLEESNGYVDYQGFIFPKRRGELPDYETQLHTIQFDWHGLLKSVSSTLIGVSPEFEIALYTLCFFTGEEDNHVHVGPYTVNIKCYRLGVNKIGSVFPIAEH